MIKYVFFDFNGTILNDVDLCLELLNKILRKQNKEEVTLDKYLSIFTFPIRKYYELAGVDFNMNSFEELSVDFIKEYQPRSYQCEIYPHLIDVLNYLESKEIKKIVLSASQIDNLKDQLTKLKIIDKFDYILGLNNIYAKSKVDVGLNFVKENNINPTEVLMIGDTTHDYEVAKKLGFNAILFTKGHQSVEVLKECNVPLIDDLSDIIKYI